ncbi:MAG: cysteine desulfurase NifS [Monoglobales bacterium]
MSKQIYFDNAATTQVRPEVVAKMLPIFTNQFGNPSALYDIGQEAKAIVDESRASIASLIGADPKEIFFTGSGSEADNWAIRGTAYALKDKGNHIITTAFEHHAVMNTCAALEKEGFEVTYVKPDSEGIISPEDIKNAITDKTILITVMYANNEIGTIQPIAEIATIAAEYKIRFHTDAVQAAGVLPINVGELGVDMLSISAHKFHGPKGIGALYIKKGTKINNLISGGGQEQGKRAGTENVAFIAGMAKAFELAHMQMDENRLKVAQMRDYLIANVVSKIPRVKVNGHLTKRLPGNANFSIECIEGESLLLLLNMNGIAASSGSACASMSLDPSHVLLSIGLPHEIAHGSIRVTLSDENTYEEIDYFVDKLEEIVKKLRGLSPLWEEKEDK